MEFDEAWPFSDGLARVRAGGRAGFIDGTGGMTINLQFDFANSFHEGVAVIGVHGLAGMKSGYIDKSGQVVIMPQFDAALDFSDGVAVVEVEDRWGTIDVRGEFIAKPQFAQAWQSTNGLVRVIIDHGLTYVEPTGRIIRPSKNCPRK